MFNAGKEEQPKELSNNNLDLAYFKVLAVRQLRMIEELEKRIVLIEAKEFMCTCPDHKEPHRHNIPERTVAVECEHEWSKPTTAFSYQFCLKKGCNAQRGNIIENKPSPEYDEPAPTKPCGCLVGHSCAADKPSDTITLSRGIAVGFKKTYEMFGEAATYERIYLEICSALGKDKK
jgi:hypothetical protein